MAISPGELNYSVTPDRLVTTVLANTGRDWHDFLAVTGEVAGAGLEPLPVSTPDEIEEAVDAYHDALTERIADRRQVSVLNNYGEKVTSEPIIVDKKIVTIAVVRALYMGGRVGRLTLVGRIGNMAGKAKEFEDRLVDRRMRRYAALHPRPQARPEV